MRSPVDLIVAKRDGEVLSADEIGRLVRSYAAGEVPDYQMSAFLMAGLLRGFEESETEALTEAMLHSGEVLDLSDIPGAKVDKHSTGGVGDKVSLVLAPLVAACGVTVPMISGRSLGHSGGTLDKLEAIPGFRTRLSLEQTLRQLREIGVVMIGQTEEIAPADRKLYALRDVTGTVECVPYIAASIMSKKLAEGIDGLVLDVKCGRGAFMKHIDDARRLAERLVEIGEAFGKRTVAWVTNMDAPLGYGIGNWPETLEAIRCLRGEPIPEIGALVERLAGEMLWLGGVAASPEAGRVVAGETLRSGRAFERFLAMVRAQGGDPKVVEFPETRSDFRPAGDVVATEDGVVAEIDALAIGRTAMAIGAGRGTKEDGVDPTAGIVLNKKPGDSVHRGELLATLYARKPHVAGHLADIVRRAFVLADRAPAAGTLLLGRHSLQGWRPEHTRRTELRG